MSNLIYAPITKFMTRTFGEWIEHEFFCYSIKRAAIRKFKNINQDALEFTDTCAYMLRAYNGIVPPSSFWKEGMSRNFSLPAHDNDLKLMLAAIYKSLFHTIQQASPDLLMLNLNDFVVDWFVVKYKRDDLTNVNWNW